jgi:hypothetical protein
MLVLQGLYTYLPVMNTLFHSVPIGLVSWGRILAVGLIAYVVVGMEKWVRRQWARSPEDAGSRDEHRGESAGQSVGVMAINVDLIDSRTKRKGSGQRAQ